MQPVPEMLFSPSNAIEAIKNMHRRHLLRLLNRSHPKAPETYFLSFWWTIKYSGKTFCAFLALKFWKSNVTYFHELNRI